MIQIKLIIAGGRDFTDYSALNNAFLEFMPPCGSQKITIISGMARGADKLGLAIAKDYGLETIKMPADWDTYGKSAGHIRNNEMAQIGTHLLVAWDGKSRGTKGMIKAARKHNLIVKVIVYGIEYPLPIPKHVVGL